MLHEKLDAIFKNFVRDFEVNNRPLVAYTALWPFLRNYPEKPEQISKIIIEVMLKYFPNFLMPTFTKGYVNGICNLDIESSTTGFISEFFRQKYSTVRTLTAFFSFAVVGEYQNELANLRPQHAWGENSLYHWFEEIDAIAMMFGTDPTHCS